MPELPVAPEQGERPYYDLADPLVGVTAGASRWMVPTPGLAALVDAQVRAMRAHVRGAYPELNLDGLPALRGDDSATAATRTPASAELGRLQREVITLTGRLPMSESTTPVLEAAARGLVAELGPAAAYRGATEAQAQPLPSLRSELREGIAYLRIPHLKLGMGARALGVLAQWADAEAPPRALVLDLSACGGGVADSAAELIFALAPGKRAFLMRARDGNTGKDQLLEFSGSMAQGMPAYQRMPLVVVTSGATVGFAEAVVHALRTHRGALVYGQPASASGTAVHWIELPWGAEIGIPTAQLLDASARPLEGHVAVPDACNIDGALVQGAPARCEAQSDPPELHLLWRYVLARFSAETPATVPAVTPSQ